MTSLYAGLEYPQQSGGTPYEWVHLNSKTPFNRVLASCGNVAKRSMPVCFEVRSSVTNCHNVAVGKYKITVAQFIQHLQWTRSVSTNFFPIMLGYRDDLRTPMIIDTSVV